MKRLITPLILYPAVLCLISLLTPVLAQDTSQGPAQDVAQGIAPGNTSAEWRGRQDELPLRVTVIARGHTIPESVQQTQPWWAWGNTEADAYLFALSGDGGTDLIVDFWPVPGQAQNVQATLFHLRGAARRGVRFDPSSPTGYTLPPNTDPALTVQPVGGRWLLDGKPNFNLIARRYSRFEGFLQEFHGRVGARQPGEPRWETSRLMNDPNPLLGYPRFNATVRADPSVVYELAPPLMPTWPYLSVTPSVFHWGPERPVVFETSTGRLEQHWAGFHTAGSYQINSLSLPPQTDFEAPFAFYRFDPAAGRYANLVMRSDVWPASSPFGPPLPGVQRTALRMTWTREDPKLWRYSLTLLGNHAMKTRVKVGRAQVRAVPYRAFPRWAAEKPWKVATFIEATEGQGGSEGIYDYTVEDNYPVSLWAEGLRAEAPESFRAPRLTSVKIGPGQLAEGLRGEYSTVYNRAPKLYVSPIDGRIHLLHAEGGVWNLGEASVLRVANLDGDAYLDAWWRERLGPDATRAAAGREEEALYRIDDLLIYSSRAPDSRVVFKKSAFPVATGRPPVPTDKGRWQAFLKGDTSPARARDPWALGSWLAAFPGEQLELPGARLTEVQSSARDLRFVLELPPDAAAPQGDFKLSFGKLPFGELAPGRYVVRYNRKTQVWSHEQATPPRLTADLGAAAPTTFTPTDLELRVHNAGTVDFSGTARLKVGPKVVKRWPSFELGGDEVFRAAIPWVPEQAGRWPVTLEIGQRNLRLGNLEVTPAPRVAEVRALLLPLQNRTPILALLGGLVLLGLSALLRVWRAA